MLTFLLLFIPRNYLHQQIVAVAHKGHLGTFVFSNKNKALVDGAGFDEEALDIPRLVGRHIMQYSNRLFRIPLLHQQQLLGLVAVGELKIGELVAAIFKNA